MAHKSIPKPIKRHFIITSYQLVCHQFSSTGYTNCIVGTNGPTFSLEEPIIYDRIGWFRRAVRHSASRTGLFCSILRLTWSEPLGQYNFFVTGSTKLNWIYWPMECISPILNIQYQLKFFCFMDIGFVSNIAKISYTYFNHILRN